MKKISEMETINTESGLQLKDIISIYQITCEDNRVYNNILWQFPTALITVNGVLLQVFEEGSPFILLIISILNFGLIHALFKLGHNQHSLILALQRTEKWIKRFEQSQYQQFLPDFNINKPKILALSSRNLINYMLLLTNIIYFVIESISAIKVLS